MAKTIFVGIDEAGLGPVLGPLCYGCVALSSDHEELSIIESEGRKIIEEQKLSIEDSKKLYAGKRKKEKLNDALNELNHYFLRSEPCTIRDFIRFFPLNEWGHLIKYRWYDGLEDLKLPFQLFDVSPNSSTDSFSDKKQFFQPLESFFTMMFAGELNHLFDTGWNKSQASMQKIQKIILYFLEKYKKESIEFLIDKQGGRDFYLDFLSQIFPFKPLEILIENKDTSLYQIEIPQEIPPELNLDSTDSIRKIRFGFYKKGESRHFLIASASLFAKWLREQSMDSFNFFWCRYNNRIKPTAGYPVDGNRYIREMLPEFQKECSNLDLIIRQR